MSETISTVAFSKGGFTRWRFVLVFAAGAFSKYKHEAPASEYGKRVISHHAAYNVRKP